MEDSKKNDPEVIVPRRRKKVLPRDKTPDPNLRINRLSKCSDSENESIEKTNDDRNTSDHKRKILEKKNKTILQRRSMSNPRVIDNQQQSELFQLLKAAKRSLSSPRDIDNAKLPNSDKRSTPNLVHESKILSKSRNSEKRNVNASKQVKTKSKEITNNNTEISKPGEKTMVYNDNYESSTESCSIGESDDITPAIMEPIIKKNEPEKTKAEIRTTNAVKTSPGKQIKPTKKDSEKSSYILLIRDSRILWKHFKLTHSSECRRIRCLTNKCISDMIAMLIFCGCGGMIFKFTEGAFENFYKCGVKRVKRDFIDQLWQTSMHMREEDWKSQARHKLRAFEEELHTAHEAGMKTYSGQRGWSFLNGVVYCLTVVTTIGYGHISPVTTTGRAITIAYAIIGIPLFLILLADFGKLFTRCIKFVWAFVRRLYYTGSCRKVRRTAPVQEVMKGFNMINDLAHFRRPSQPSGPNMTMTDPELAPSGGMRLSQSAPSGMPQTPGYLTAPSTGAETPQTPAPSAFEIDDEFNLPISVAITILLVYIFIGATIYYIWEDWGFFESFYFVFISMSTIGFGDFVPQHPIYMMASIVYLVFGLALTSMCINVVQVKLSDSFRQASAKIGATIGLKMAEEEASAQGTPPEVEIAEVHGSTSKTRNKT